MSTQLLAMWNDIAGIKQPVTQTTMKMSTVQRLSLYAWPNKFPTIERQTRQYCQLCTMSINLDSKPDHSRLYGVAIITLQWSSDWYIEQS